MIQPMHRPIRNGVVIMVLCLGVVSAKAQVVKSAAVGGTNPPPTHTTKVLTTLQILALFLGIPITIS